MDNTKELTHISLCAGYGGIDIGLKRAIGNVRTIAFSEIEAYAVSNLVAKMEKGWLDAAPIWSNLKTFPWGEFYKKVDIISGGFPCQPFSAAGKKRGDEDPRHLWPYIVKGIRELGKPPIVFFENVEGIISSRIKSDDWSDPKGTDVLQHVLRELERLGYKTTAGIFSASEIGAPHQRKRVFILGIKLGNIKHIRSFIKSIQDRSLEECSRKKGENRTSEFKNFARLEDVTRLYDTTFNTAYPLGLGQYQYEWEAPRAIKELSNSISKRTQGKASRQLTGKQISKCNHEREIESKVGRADHGIASGLGSSEFLESYDNRTDELRLLGNGVVPDTATKAFRILLKRIEDDTSKEETYP